MEGVDGVKWTQQLGKCTVNTSNYTTRYESGGQNRKTAADRCGIDERYRQGKDAGKRIHRMELD